MPAQDNTEIELLPYERLQRPDPAYPALELNAMAQQKRWVLQSQTQHVVPGVNAKMMDWFWANMEKCYYL